MMALHSITVSTQFRSALLIGAGICAALLVISIASIVGIALHIVNTLIRPKRSETFLPVAPSVFGLPAEEVQFAPLHGEHLVKGLYIPRDGATSTIILCPGYRRTLKDVLSVGAHLWKAGHTVLIFEYYGHGTVVGTPITLGYREMDDLRGAVGYVKQRTPTTRIGVMGYSMGGSIALLVSAHTPEVEAVIADSAFATAWNAVEVAVHRTLRLKTTLPGWILASLRQITDTLLYWRARYHFHQVEPVRVIGCIAPRPVLLIHGTRDSIVKHTDAECLYAAAGEAKTLWLIPGSEHTRGYFVHSDVYVERVTTFFAFLMCPLPPSQRPSSHLERTPKEPVQETASLFSHEEHRTHSMPQALLLWGAFIFRFRWAVLLFWMLVFAISLPLAGRVTSVLTNGGYTIAGSESQRATQAMTSILHQPSAQLLVVLHSDTSLVSSSEYQQEMHVVMTRAKQLPHIMMVTQGETGKDGRSTFIALGFDEDNDTLAQHVPELRHTLTDLAGPQVAHLSLTGDAVIASEVALSTQSETEAAERIALPFTLLALLVVFGTLSAALMPLLLASIAVMTTLAIVYEIAHSIPVNIFAYNLISILGLGLAIDYSIFMVRRFRDELAQGSGVQQALQTTLATAGEAILVSAAIVVMGFAGLLLIGIEIMSSFAIGGMVVTVSAALAALTLLPALLSILGTHINALRVPLLPRFSLRGRTHHQSFWQHWAYVVMRRPIPVIFVVLALLAFLAWPARALNPGVMGVDALPPSSTSRQALTLLQAQFPHESLDPLLLVVHSSDGSAMLSAPNLHHIEVLTQWIARQPHVTTITSLMRPPLSSNAPALSEQNLVQLYRSGLYLQMPELAQFVQATTTGEMTMISISTTTLSGSWQDQALIEHLRAPTTAKAGLVTQVGGVRAVNQDFMDALYSKFFTRTLPFTLLVTFLVLLAIFRSVLLPLKAILMNILSISASYGALVWIFQDGNFQQQLGFSANGSIDRFIPPLLFTVIYGLSMDYEVFLLSRIREEWLRTHENQRAVALGIEKTGAVITNAALLFMIVSAAFLTTHLIVSKELGASLCIAVGLDASIIRMLLVPASMKLLGTWNWWFPGTRRAGTMDATIGTQELVDLPLAPLANRVSLQSHLTEVIFMHLFAQVFAVPLEQVQVTTDFLTFGGDSARLTALLKEIHSQFHIQVPAEEVFDHPVLADLARSVTARLQESTQEPWDEAPPVRKDPLVVTHSLGEKVL